MSYFAFPPKSINLRLPQFSELSEPKNQGEKNAMNAIPSYFFTIFNSSPWKIRSNLLPPKKGLYLPLPSIFSDFSKLLRSLVGKKAVSQLIRGIDFDTPAAAECLRVRLTAEAETPTRLGLAFRTSLSEKKSGKWRYFFGGKNRNQHFFTEAHGNHGRIRVIAVGRLGKVKYHER